MCVCRFPMPGRLECFASVMSHRRRVYTWQTCKSKVERMIVELLVLPGCTNLRGWRSVISKDYEESTRLLYALGLY